MARTFMSTPPTPVTSLDQIDFLESPKHIRVTSMSTFNEAILRIWVWNGSLTYPTDNVPMPYPTRVLKESKVSVSDTYIQFEISDYINSLIVPELNWTKEDGMTTLNEGVFYKYEYDLLQDGVPIVGASNLTDGTHFATRGWNWNYEGENTASYNYGSFGFVNTSVKNQYYQYLSYSNPRFVLGATSSEGMVHRTPYVPTKSELVYSSQPVIIAYINKIGLWDTFSATGMVNFQSTITRDSYDRATRNPKGITRQNYHSTINYNLKYKDSYVINTGIIPEEMGQRVEEIISSPKVYLIVFEKPLKISGGAYITIDTTAYTADTTLFTADNSGENMTVNGTRFQQVPVVVTQSDFGRKTKAIDRAKIDYNITFDSANNKVNNIR